MNKLIPKTFLWMFVGLMVTFVTGYVISINETMLESVLGSMYWVIVIIELALVFFLSLRVHKMSPTTAKFSFILYSFFSGLTFSVVFALFEISSVMSVFLISAALFAAFGLIGYFTKLDLTKLGTYLLMALIGTLICVIVNMFTQNSTLDLVISIVLILIFVGFTAYDIQKIKKLSEEGIDNDVVAISGALQLYLDYINIFLHLLSIIGDAKD